MAELFTVVKTFRTLLLRIMLQSVKMLLKTALVLQMLLLKARRVSVKER